MALIASVTNAISMSVNTTPVTIYDNTSAPDGLVSLTIRNVGTVDCTITVSGENTFIIAAGEARMIAAGTANTITANTSSSSTYLLLLFV